MAETIALVAALTALCAVLLGPLVSLWVAQKQVSVSVLSANRQVWINTLRDQLAEFSSILAVIHAGEWAERTEKEYDEELKQMIFLVSKIKLMLNPKEEDHERLSSLLTKAAQTVRARAKDEKVKSTEGVQLDAEMLPLSQSILKREWERVKQTK